MITTFELDQLEAKAVRSIVNTYGPIYEDDKAAFWVQKGIEGMRYAIAETCLELDHED